MSIPGEDGKDEASIKPVSSLRSLFEKKTSDDTGFKHLSTSRPLTTSNHAQDNNPTLTHASVDVPRRLQAWSASEVTIGQQRKEAQGPPVPRPRRPNSRILQRPVSAISLSTPRSPPLVTVDTPTSTPKPNQSASIHHDLQLSSSQFLSTSNISVTSPPLVPASMRRLESSLASKPGPAMTSFQGSSTGVKRVRTIVDDVPAQQITKNPPPVNRAEKPNIPFRSTPIPDKVNLEPFVAVADERISPFSTPPSSDESPFAESSKYPRLVDVKSGHEEIRNPTNRDVFQDKTSRPTDEFRLRVGKISSDPQPSGSPPAPGLPNAVPGNPPVLPPRREQFQRSAQAKDVTIVSKGSPSTGNFRLPDRSKQAQNASKSTQIFLPPPKRAPIPVMPTISDQQYSSLPRAINRSPEPSMLSEGVYSEEQEHEHSSFSTPVFDSPDASNINRRPPYSQSGALEIDTIDDTRIIDICGQYVATAGHITRVWDLMSGELVASLNYGEKDIRVTSLAFKPATTVDEEGSDLWLGTNSGEIQEANIATQSIVAARTGPHERREVVKIHRYQSSLWTLDNSGRLCVWSGDDRGLPSLQRNPIFHKVPKDYSFSLVIQGYLWLATGKDIRIFQPNSTNDAGLTILQKPVHQHAVGAITSGAAVGNQLDRVYFSHADGKITIYSTTEFMFLGVVSVSNYRISCLVGVGSYLWAGYSTGIVSVLDTRTQPWITKKEWLAHGNPIFNIMVDPGSLWRNGVMRVVSLGGDNVLRFWDGTLETDWLENDMHDRDIEYCSFRELTALVVSWNAGAATPTHLRYDERDSQFFQDVLQGDSPHDLLIFGFQELVDLEDKKLTAKSLFKGNKKKAPSEQEHMSHQYRAWRDFLIRCIEDSMPSKEPYYLLHTASMVGLFSCVFIKASQRNNVRNFDTVEVKRGMGGLHGNKGALILRFVLDDSSICLANCHLAAGQTQTVNRNNDITAILESSLLPSHHKQSKVSDTFVGGGDGCMILDHEICILNGDLNYRIDTMGRDTVVKAIYSNNLSTLLERDQLLVSRRRNPAFRVRAFIECPITFAPTYKYDVGSDQYDTSEKRRAPAWCDRILYRGAGKIKQLSYRRHELRVSDHRPVSGRFQMRIKTIDAGKRDIVWSESEIRLGKARESLAKEARVQYLRDVLGVPPDEAKRLI